MEGNFDNLPLDNCDKEMLKDAYDTITNLGLWEWMRKPETPGENGFMFSKDPEVGQISTAMKFQGHSGASFGMTMRVMELIAKKGWDAYCMTIRAPRFRIAWEMENGHSDKGEPIFSSRAQAEDFIKHQKEHDMEEGWSINYWIERV